MINRFRLNRSFDYNLLSTSTSFPAKYKSVLWLFTLFMILFLLRIILFRHGTQEQNGGIDKETLDILKSCVTNKLYHGKLEAYCGPGSRGEPLHPEANFSTIIQLTTLELNITNNFLKLFNAIQIVDISGLRYQNETEPIVFTSLDFLKHASSLKNLKIDDVDLELATFPILGSVSLESIKICCNIHSIPKDAFKNAVNLTRVHFVGNKISTLPNQLFYNNPSIEHVYFSKNNISDIEGVFNGLNALRHLELRENQVRVITNFTFQGCEKLRYLKLSNNMLEEIASHAFYSLTKLHSLNLRNNFIKTLHLFLNFDQISTIRDHYPEVLLDQNPIKFFELKVSNYTDDILVEVSTEISGQIVLPKNISWVIAGKEWFVLQTTKSNPAGLFMIKCNQTNQPILKKSVTIGIVSSKKYDFDGFLNCDADSSTVLLTFSNNSGKFSKKKNRKFEEFQI